MTNINNEIKKAILYSAKINPKDHKFIIGLIEKSGFVRKSPSYPFILPIKNAFKVYPLLQKLKVFYKTYKAPKPQTIIFKHEVLPTLFLKNDTKNIILTIR
jgi:hypothetical protein